MTTNETSSVFRNYSQEIKRLLARSKLINEYYEKDFDISFSSIFLAFLANDDPISRWFSGYVKVGGIDVQRILEERNVNQQMSMISHRALSCLKNKSKIANLARLDLTANMTVGENSTCAKNGKIPLAFRTRV